MKELPQADLKREVNDAISMAKFTGLTQFVVYCEEIDYIGRVTVPREGMEILAVIQNKFKVTKDTFTTKIYNRTLSNYYHAVTRNTWTRMQLLRALVRLKAIRRSYNARHLQKDTE